MRPLLGTWPTPQACALTGNHIGDTLFHRLLLNPLTHTSQSTIKYLVKKEFLYIVSCFYVECINFYKGYILLLDCYLYLYVVSFFVCYHGLCFKFYFVRYKYCFPSFLKIFIFMKYFPIPLPIRVLSILLIIIF